MTAPALEARDLVLRYPSSGVLALDGVSLALAPGELVCVIGPNGSGKSTLVRVLAGLLRPDAGTVLAGGRPLADLPHRERARRVAVVPQSLASIPDVSVRAFAMGGRYAHTGPFGGFFARTDPRDLREVERALARAELSGEGERALLELSGGQRQRALLARALAQDAPLWLVDEPTTSLDVEHQVRAFDLVAEGAREGRAVLVVTHDLNLAARYATRLVVLAAGRVAAGGAAREVLVREVLEPIYGPHLHFGAARDAAGREHPFVVPWPDAGPDAAPRPGG